MSEKTLNVKYVSVWDGGHEIVTNAKYDTSTGLVFDIETVEGINEQGEEVEVLDREYIILPGEQEVALNVIERDGNYYTVVSIF
jgi:hypothetical protein